MGAGIDDRDDNNKTRDRVRGALFLCRYYERDRRTVEQQIKSETKWQEQVRSGRDRGEQERGRRAIEYDRTDR